MKIPQNFDGAAFTRKFGNVEFHVLDGQLVCPSLSQLTEEDIADCITSPIAPLAQAIERHVDAIAASRNYRSAESCASYANSQNPTWSEEGRIFCAWRDAVWECAYEIMSACLAGQRLIPTPAELIAELPVIDW